MGKNIKESDLLKALGELEALASVNNDLAKGDKLEDADTEGGFSTEGQPLSKKTPSGRAPLSKAESMSDQESADDAGSEDDDDNESPDASSMENESDDDMSKSLYQSVQEDDELSKAVEVSDFLEGLTRQISDSNERMVKSLARQITSAQREQQDFQTRLARGLVSMGTVLQKAYSRIDALETQLSRYSNAPRTPQGKALLTKSDVSASPLDGEAENEPLSHSDVDRITDWMIAKSVPPEVITQFELSGYNINALPIGMRKSLLNDLKK